MLYPQNRSDTLDKQTFQNPSSEYRGTPFWAWNCELEKDELLWQIEQMKAMGLGGFHMHCRSGMSTNYLSDEFMDLIKACVEKAEKEKMLAWLYDEDRWPSGAAGGLVTKDREYRARHLLFTPYSYEMADDALIKERLGEEVNRSGDGTLLTRYAIKLDVNGYLDEYRLLGENEAAPDGFEIWYAYLEVQAPSPWYNNQTYINTLNPKAIARFIEVTHERYKEIVGEAFGKTVPAIFTDEPQFSHRSFLQDPFDKTDAILPWTDDFTDTFQAQFHYDLMDKLPELFWELPADAVSSARFHFQDHLAERFATAFADQCGEWCAKNNIMLTGHMMMESSLYSQTAALGEAMRSYRSFQLPGIDMLCDDREYTTAKQAQSAAHQFGAPGVLSELYGVTNWDFDFRGHKLQGDWQAALGITVRVHHLSWVSMAGEAKRDYPASIHYQSPWAKDYAYIEDHFARVNTALTRGKADVRIGVIHPVESYWLKFGPNTQTSDVRNDMETNFENFINWMIFGFVDFDYISESLLPRLTPEGGAPLQVGQMKYDVIIVPNCLTLRSTTLERLEAFQVQGGKLIFLQDAPEFVDALPSERGKKLAAKSQMVPFASAAILRALDEYRNVDVILDDGYRTKDLLHQMREDGDDKWLFIAHGLKPKNTDHTAPKITTIKLNGFWTPTVYDTLSGQIKPIACTYSHNKTLIPYAFYSHDSLLLRLEPGKKADAVFEALPAVYAPKHSITAPVPVTLSEPNVLVMDIAQYAFDDGAWQPEEEILISDNLFRQKLGFPERRNAFPQPWVLPNPPIKNTFHLRFTIESEVAVTDAQLALEDAERVAIRLNGQSVKSDITGYFTDKSIKTVKLPAIPAGTSTIELDVPFGVRTNTEWCYLLGSFGVRVQGTQRTLTAPVTTLGFGDFVPQGLPFYCGNVTYHMHAESTGGDLVVHVSHYRGAAMKVAVDGKDAGYIVFSPYTLVIPGVAAGMHSVDITLLGTRINGFGQLHMSDNTYHWFGPDSWRTEGDEWCYEYRTKPQGILVAPVIEAR